jgi:hypothetical protein
MMIVLGLILALMALGGLAGGALVMLAAATSRQATVFQEMEAIGLLLIGTVAFAGYAIVAAIYDLRERLERRFPPRG